MSPRWGEIVAGQRLIGTLLVVMLDKPAGGFCDFLQGARLLQTEAFLLKGAVLSFHRGDAGPREKRCRADCPPGAQPDAE